SDARAAPRRLNRPKPHGARFREQRLRQPLTDLRAWLVRFLPYAQTGGSGRTLRRHAASRVLRNRHAIVIGPTPPGTGVIATATRRTESKSTSPTRWLPPLGKATVLTP